MTVLVSDSFNRADNATLGITDSYNGGTATTWTNINGTLGITNQVVTTSGTDAFAIVDSGQSDVVVSVAVVSTANNGGVYFRVTDANNWWRAVQVASTLYIQKNVNGTITTLQQINGITWVSGDIIKVNAYGNTITVFQNGYTLGSVTDTFNQTVTKHGFGVQSSSAGTFDNFEIDTGTQLSYTVTTGQGYYLSLDTTGTQYVSVPYPSSAKYLKMTLTRKNNDTSGYLFDFRTANTIYLASNANSGYSNFEINQTNYVPAPSNVTALVNNIKSDVTVSLSSATISGTMTIGARYTHDNSADFLSLNLYALSFLDTNHNVIQSFDFSTGSGTTLNGTAGNGTIYGATWVSNPDYSGGTGTTYTGGGTSQGTSSLTQSEKVIANANSTLSGTSTISSTETYIQNTTTYSGTGNPQGISSLTNTEKVIKSESDSIQGLSSVTNNETLINKVTGNIQGNSLVNTNEHYIYGANGSTQGISTVTSAETLITHTGTSYGGSGNVQSSVNITSTDKVISSTHGNIQSSSTVTVRDNVIYLPNITISGLSTVSSSESFVGHATTVYSGSGNTQGIVNLSNTDKVIYLSTVMSQGSANATIQELISYLTSVTVQGNSLVASRELYNSIIEYKQIVDLIMTIHPELNLTMTITPVIELKMTI